METHRSSQKSLLVRHFRISFLFFIVSTLYFQSCHAQYSDACRSIDRKIGTCVPLNYCPMFSSWLKMRPLVKENLRLLVKYTCFFDTRHPKVCCPNEDLFPEQEESVIVGFRIGSPVRRGIDTDSPSSNKLIFPTPSLPSLQFPTPSPPASESTDKADSDASMLETERSRGYVPLSFPSDKQERGKAIWDIHKTNKNPFHHLKDFRHHPNFKLIPQLQECSNAVKLDSLNGAYGAWPWLSLIGIKRKHTLDFQHICAGVVINERYILTAAHCFERIKPNYVRLGEYNLGSLIDQGSEFLPQSRRQDFRIEKRTVHPLYNRTTGANDIALIRVDRNIPLNTTFIKAICLPFINEYEINNADLNNAKDLDGKPGWIAGWARHSFGGRYSTGSNSNVLQEGIVDFAPYANCLRDHSQLTPLNARTQVCVGGKNRRNSCNADSGGPLMVPVKVPSKIPGFKEPKFFLLGLLSEGPTGSMCHESSSNPSANSDSLLPSSVFTRVSKYLTWILENMQDSNKEIN